MAACGQVQADRTGLRLLEDVQAKQILLAAGSLGVGVLGGAQFFVRLV